MRIFASKVFRAPLWTHSGPASMPLSSLQKRARHFFSELKQGAVLLGDAQLVVRNSETYELKLQEVTDARKIQNLVYQIDAKESLKSIAELFEKTFVAKNTQFYCEKGGLISSTAPLEALLNRTFYIASREAGYKIRVKGQLLSGKLDERRQEAAEQLRENLRQLQLPVIAQREIEGYFNRVEIWLDAKYGGGARMKLKEKEVQDILVQAIMDPQAHWNTINSLQQEWFKKYVEIRQLREKKQRALKLAERMSVRYMSLGVGLIAANIGFIWSGTYVFYSWDIIEPIAYFTSSLASIVLFAQFFKLRKPFSLQNYRAYLIEHYLPRASEKIGLNLSDLQSKQRELQVVESIIKDYLIAKL